MQFILFSLLHNNYLPESAVIREYNVVTIYTNVRLSRYLYLTSRRLQYQGLNNNPHPSKSTFLNKLINSSNQQDQHLHPFHPKYILSPAQPPPPFQNQLNQIKSNQPPPALFILSQSTGSRNGCGAAEKSASIVLFSSPLLFSSLYWSCRWFAAVSAAAASVSADAELQITSVGGGGALDVGALRGAERARLDGMKREGFCLWDVKSVVIPPFSFSLSLSLFFFYFALYGRY